MVKNEPRIIKYQKRPLEQNSMDGVIAPGQINFSRQEEMLNARPYGFSQLASDPYRTERHISKS